MTQHANYNLRKATNGRFEDNPFDGQSVCPDISLFCLQQNAVRRSYTGDNLNKIKERSFEHLNLESIL